MDDEHFRYGSSCRRRFDRVFLRSTVSRAVSLVETNAALVQTKQHRNDTKPPPRNKYDNHGTNHRDTGTTCIGSLAWSGWVSSLTTFESIQSTTAHKHKHTSLSLFSFDNNFFIMTFKTATLAVLIGISAMSIRAITIQVCADTASSGHWNQLSIHTELSFRNDSMQRPSFLAFQYALSMLHSLIHPLDSPCFAFSSNTTTDRSRTDRLLLWPTPRGFSRGLWIFRPGF